MSSHGTDDESMKALAEWLSMCMAGSSGLPYEIGPPDVLIDDDAAWWLGTGMQWGAQVVK